MSEHDTELEQAIRESDKDQLREATGLTPVEERICINCKHCIRDRDNVSKSLCAKSTNPDFDQLALVIGKEAAEKSGLRRHLHCSTERIGTWSDSCGTIGRWFEPKEAE